MAKRNSYGFGFIPEEAQHHFLVLLSPANQNKDVLVYERFTWDDEREQQITGLPEEKMVLNEIEGRYGVGEDEIRLKVSLNRHKWDLVKPALEMELNRILKEDNKRVARFKIGQNPVERLLGKEMMVLLWAIEDCDPVVIPRAIKNWLGFSREERWWLFTMTNAATGGADDKIGWRIALRYALTQNPVTDEKKQADMFSSLEQSVGAK